MQATANAAPDPRRSTKKRKGMIATPKPKRTKPRCGLCGKAGKARKTDCCGNWICDDHDKYVLFSYARNSCSRNHDRYTLCAYHHGEGHSGHWKDCKECRDSFKTEMYVWYGTNEYNFEKLDNPPAFEPTLCSGCGKVIHLGTDGYAQLGDKYTCEKCHEAEMRKKVRQVSGASSRRQNVKSER